MDAIIPTIITPENALWILILYWIINQVWPTIDKWWQRRHETDEQRQQRRERYESVMPNMSDVRHREFFMLIRERDEDYYRMVSEVNHSLKGVNESLQTINQSISETNQAMQSVHNAIHAVNLAIRDIVPRLEMVESQLVKIHRDLYNGDNH